MKMKKFYKSKKFFKFLFVLSLLAFSSIKAYSSLPESEEDLPKALEEASQAVWRIESPEKEIQGSGFFIGPNLFVTNFHIAGFLIERNLFNKAYLSKGDKQIKLEKVLALSVDPDLALLETKSSVSNSLQLKEPPLDFEEPLFIVGYPAGEFHIMEGMGNIRIIGDDFIFFSEDFFPGASGGPLLDSKGSVAGVLHSYIDIKASSVSLDVFKKFIEQSKSHPCGSIPIECFHEALQVFYKKADQENNANAQHYLALMYYHGEVGVEKDSKLFVDWLERAARQAHVEAQYTSYIIYSHGIEVEKNETAGLYWLKQLEKSVSPAHVFIQHEIGIIYKNGIGLEKNYELAFYWLKKAADQGYFLAQYNIFWLYYYGRGTEVNQALAVDLMRKSARQGYAPAQYQLALIYEEGLGGMEKDEELYAYWLEKAADQGHLSAQYEWNQYLEKG